ncbi:MAG: UbiX family flavin prenyltransferase [Alphaproteobacteria bacterium]|nr:UbiX family flavin prenyltransferase [Alphaproteobacteria bacterium]
MTRLVVGVGGASGAVYAQRLLGVLAARGDVEAHVVFSKMGRVVWHDEIGTDPADLGFPLYASGDMAAAFASGSARFDGMVVVPCSGGGLGRIAHGLSTDLVGRAADVCLKERRPLLLVLRESPYSLVHCRNMVAATEAGATIIPASPSFYSRPGDLGAAVDTVVARVMDHLGLADHTLQPRWTGLQGGAA